jgi:CubicO group peptidase (beta-lactamase class C family)
MKMRNKPPLLMQVICGLVTLLMAACNSKLPASPTLAPSPPLETVLPGEDELTALLKRMVDQEKRATGMVIGMIAPNEKVIVGYGKLNEDGDRAPDASSLFEIGSISKVFIGTLLADAVRRGEVHPDDPASLYLPATVKLPQWDGVPITLLDLATHTSGLPRELSGRPTQDLTPGAWVQAMYEFLSNCELTHKPGTKYVYSNIGMTLLAHILARRTGIPYERLLAERVLQPLGMMRTGFEPARNLLPHLATGHNSVLHPVDTYEYSMLDHVYVGGMISSAEDMLKFASAVMGLEPSTLLPAFQDAVQPQRFAWSGKTGLAWLIEQGTYPIVHHSGQTSGMHAYLGFDPQRKIGVVVLANAAVPMDDIGPHLLYPSRYALETHQPRAIPTSFSVAPDVLASYAGDYEFDGLRITIVLDGDQLIMVVPDQESFTMIPDSEAHFLLEEYEATVRFLTAGGQVSGFVLDQAAASQIYTFMKVGLIE